MKRITRRALPANLHDRARHLERNIRTGNTPGVDARGELARVNAAIARGDRP